MKISGLVDGFKDRGAIFPILVWSGFARFPGPFRSGQSLGHPAFRGSAIRSLPPQQAAAATPPAPLQSGLVSPRIPERSRRIHIPTSSFKNCIAILGAKVTKDHAFLLNQTLSPRIPERSRRVRVPIKSSKNCPCNS